MYELTETARFNIAGSNTQGVCFDGTYYYTTDSTTLRKYNTSGTLVASHDCSTDGSGHHLGDLCLKDGTLYVACSNYPSTPMQGYVKEYSTSLTYITEHTVRADTACGIDYSGGSFWIIYNFVIEERDTSFNLLNTYTPGTHITGRGMGEGWQGGVWVDDKLYLTIHELNFPDCVQVLDSDLNLVENINRPAYCSQGIAYYGGNFIMALRHGPDAVVTTELLANDWRTERAVYGVDTTTQSITSTSYSEDHHLSVTINAKKGDIVKVEMDGLFKVSASSLRAYVDISDTSTDTAVTALIDNPSLRTNSTASDFVSQHFMRLFRADVTGKFTFGMQWKMQGSGTGSMYNRSMVAQIVGRESESF